MVFNPTVIDGGFGADSGNSGGNSENYSLNRVMQQAVGLTRDVAVDESSTIKLHIPTPIQGTQFWAHVPATNHSITDPAIAQSAGLAIFMKPGFSTGVSPESIVNKSTTLQTELRGKLGIDNLYVEAVNLTGINAPDNFKKLCPSALVVLCPQKDCEKLRTEGATMLQSIIDSHTALRQVETDGRH